MLIYTLIYTCIYMYVYVYVPGPLTGVYCMAICEKEAAPPRSYSYIVYSCIYTHMHIYIYMYVYICKCIYIYIFMYIYIYVSMHICIYLFMYRFCSELISFLFGFFEFVSIDSFSIWLLGHPWGPLCQPDASFERSDDKPNKNPTRQA